MATLRDKSLAREGALREEVRAASSSAAAARVHAVMHDLDAGNVSRFFAIDCGDRLERPCMSISVEAACPRA